MSTNRWLLLLLLLLLSNSKNGKEENYFDEQVASALSNEHAQSQQLKLMISLNDVCCKYDEDDKKQLLKNVNIQIDGPQNLMITGTAGSEKSSLLLAILGELAIYLQRNYRKQRKNGIRWPVTLGIYSLEHSVTISRFTDRLISLSFKTPWKLAPSEKT